MANPFFERSMNDREKEQLKAMIDAGEMLPVRYKAVLFEQSHEVTNVVLPFQPIEQIDEPQVGTSDATPSLKLDDKPRTQRQVTSIRWTQ